VPYKFKKEYTNTFQIILHESGDIEFKYYNVYSLGENDTAAGIENVGGTAGLQYTPLSEKGYHRSVSVYYKYPVVNHAPTADAGPDQGNVDAGDLVTLDGSGSYDPDKGDTLTYQWTQTGDGTQVTVQNRTTAYPKFTAPDMGSEGGTLSFELVVTDQRGLSSGADTVTITVTPSNGGVTPPPVAPVTPNSGLYFPHIVTDGEWETEICVINTSISRELEGDLIAYNEDGEELVTKSIKLAASGRQEIVVGEVFDDPDEIAYIVLEKSSGNAVGYVKYYIPGRYRAAIPAVSSDNVNTGDIYSPHVVFNDGWDTEFGILNTADSSRELELEFNNGYIHSITLGARAYQTLTLKALLGGDAELGINSAVLRNANGIVGVTTLEKDNWLCGVLMKGDLVTSIHYSHIPNDAVWKTGLVAYNPSDDSCSIDIIPYDALGNQLLSEPREISLEGCGKFIEMVGSGDLAMPEEAAWLEMSSTSSLTGLNLFATSNSYAGFSPVGTQRKGGIFPKMVDPVYGDTEFTGIAIVNTEEEDAEVVFTAYANSGEEVASTTAIMHGHSKKVRTARTLFLSDISDASYIRFSSDRNLVAFQMNMNMSRTGMGMMLDGLPVLNAEPMSVRAFIDSPADNTVFSRGTDIFFQGSGYDKDGNELRTYIWFDYPFEWTSDIDGVIGRMECFSVNDLSVGTHTITLTVTDRNTGEQATDQISIEITGAVNNEEPDVDISSPVNGDSSHAIGDTITLRGAATDAEDADLTGDSLVWSYTVVDGGDPVTVAVTGESSSFEALAAGTYVITLTATDGEGATATDTVTITVAEEPPGEPPVAYIDSITNSSGGETLYEGEAIVFTGHAYDPEKDESVTESAFGWEFIWKVDGGVVGKGLPFTLSEGLPHKPFEVYTVTLTVKVTRSGETLTGESSQTIFVNQK